MTGRNKWPPPSASKPTLENRRDAHQLRLALWDVMRRGDRYSVPTVAALGYVFMEVGKTITGDVTGLFEALEKAFRNGDWTLDDDPAEGRYVHPEHETVQ